MNIKKETLQHNIETVLKYSKMFRWDKDMKDYYIIFDIKNGVFEISKHINGYFVVCRASEDYEYIRHKIENTIDYLTL